MMTALHILAGLALLLGGGEAMVRGAVALGRRLGLSTLVVGILIVGVATSMPEMVVSVQAVLYEHPEIAVGNILGSNLANILLVLGLTALLRPMHHQPRALVPDGLFLMGTALFFFLLALTGSIGRLAGFAMLAGLAGYMYWEFTRTRRETRLMRKVEEEIEDEVKVPPLLENPLIAVIAVLVGLAGLVTGGDLFLRGATAVAEMFGVSKGVIGLTLVALGTSAPELASSLIAARHGHSDVAYGNVVGSNIINILGVGGAAAAVAGLSVPREMAVFDGPAVLIATVLMIVFFFSPRGLTRARALVLAGGYVAYLSVRSAVIG
jgi:cation:H+ antiporter